MTNEEMQRAMDLVAEQEARSSAKVDAIVDAQKIADVRWALTERKIGALLTAAMRHEREYFDWIYREHKRNYRRKNR
ncbi:MAG: hypothetical protein WAM70_04635 [Pyrinomonadaceae bacterium]